MSHRSLKVVTPSAVPLFTTAEAKDFLKVDTTADDYCGNRIMPNLY